LIIFSIIWCCLEMRQLCVIDEHNDMFHYGICSMPPLINQIIEFDSSSSLKRTLVNLLSSYYLPTNFNLFFACVWLSWVATMISQCFFKHLEYITRVESLGPTCIVFHFIFWFVFGCYEAC
jgi:hypothetical protein